MPTSSPTNQAIVNLSSPLQAKDAITALHGAPTDRGVLEVVSGSASAGMLSYTNIWSASVIAAKFVQYFLSNYPISQCLS